MEETFVPIEYGMEFIVVGHKNAICCKITLLFSYALYEITSFFSFLFLICYVCVICIFFLIFLFTCLVEGTIKTNFFWRSCMMESHFTKIM
jgi:hypothetical protein